MPDLTQIDWVAVGITLIVLCAISGFVVALASGSM